MLGSVLVVALLAAPPVADAVADATALRARGAPGLAAIRAPALTAHVRYLSDDLLEGRAPGTRGHALAERYVAAVFEGLGLAPAGEGGTFSQPVALRAWRVERPQSRLVLRVRGKVVPLELDRDYVLGADGDRYRVDLAAPVVFAGFGVVAPEFGWNDLAGLDLRGKIALVLAAAPSSEDPRFFPDLPRAVLSDSQLKARALRDAGAIGIITVYTPDAERIRPWPKFVAQTRLGGKVLLEEGAPASVVGVPLRAVITGAAFDRILAAAGAKVTLADLVAAARRRERPFLPALPLAAEARVRVAHRHETAHNVLAMMPGRDPALAAEPVIVTAHLDHLGIGAPVGDDAIHNGAADNATGVAQLLELARALTALPERPARPVVLAAVTAEETGFLGSEHLARHPLPAGARYAAALNLDEACWLGPLRDVVALGADESTLDRHVRAAAAALDLRISPDPAPEQVYFIRSDQWSFVQTGIPALLLYEGFVDETGGTARKAAAFERYERERYHSPNDEWDATFDAEAMADFARLAFLVALSVASDPEPPRWNEDSFLRRFERPAEGAGVTAVPHSQRSR